MITFDRIELNEETDCWECYLEGETTPRTDIPDDPECIASLIDLLHSLFDTTTRTH
jgi:hypothetical protein